MNKKERVKASLLGCALGDAFGMPFETMTSAEILNATDGQGPTLMHDPVQRKITDTKDISAGMTTDDFQLTAVVAMSLIVKGTFDVEDMAVRHVHALRTAKFGWGGTIKAGIEEFAAYYDALEHKAVGGRPPTHHVATITEAQQRAAKKPIGIGTGPAMRVAPLGLHGALRRSGGDDLFEDVMALGRMTHGDLRASFAACAVADVVQSVFLTHEEGYGIDPEALLELLISDIKVVERRYHLVGEYPLDPFSKRLERLRALFAEPSRPVASVTGVGFNSMEAVPLAIGVFLRHHGDFVAALREAVMSGGDTDTVAAMVGAMHGANGFNQSEDLEASDVVPLKWLLGLVDKGKTALNLGEAMYASATVR